MKQFNDLVQDVMDNGKDRINLRTGVGVRTVFGRQIRFDLQQAFPIVNSKFTATKAIIVELIWFLQGNTNIKYLKDNNIKIWNEWADENGDLGPVYGQMFRRWPDYQGGEIDQIQNIIDTIKSNPSDRRLIVSAWNPALISKMALPPCHCLFQFNVDPDGLLSCQLYQRSCDLMLGVPFNIASYAILTHMVAQVTGLQVGEFIHTFGDLHIYHNHFEGVEEMLERPILENNAKLWLNPEITNINDFRPEDIKVTDYTYHPHIRLPVAV
jgi:thymidylate synthase